jgi:DNA adenine methylase
MSQDQPGDIRPFLRWAGSKRKLLKFLRPYIPKTFNKYYEPFLGGGAMFFYLAPKCAEISDASPSLVRTYQAVRADPESILEPLRELKPDRRTFERLKGSAPRSPASKAIQFIFLNKACWNGLYRVNSDGIFNVPYGQPKTDFIIDEKNLRRCAIQLRRREVSTKCQDFEAINDRVRKGDFVFLDPPYVTSHNMNGFIDWNESLFRWDDQIRLASMAVRLARRGANVLITNADHPDVRKLYSSFGYRRLVRSTTLASDTDRRGRTTEAIFMGGPAYQRTLESVAERGVSHDGERRTYRPSENSPKS